MKRNDKPDMPEGGNNNFFNQNPLLIFAIFSIVAILVFKYFAAPTQEMDGMGGSQQTQGMRQVTKNLGYYDFKELVKDGRIEFVSISATSLRAVSTDGNVKTVYMVKRIQPDMDLIPLLDEKKLVGFLTLVINYLPRFVTHRAAT